MKIVIIDYNTGNVGSIKNMLKKIGYDSLVTGDHDDILNADKLILPGVGHFDYGIKALDQLGLREILDKKVLEMKTPILGICLGAQLLTRGSTEGVEKGLGWIDADTIKFDLPSESKRKLPHMGWSDVEVKNESKLFTDMYSQPRFYFVHKYHLKADNDDDVLVTTDYGYEFAAGLEHENILGVQFHPEKSHKYGKLILKNFVELTQ